MRLVACRSLNTCAIFSSLHKIQHRWIPRNFIRCGVFILFDSIFGDAALALRYDQPAPYAYAKRKEGAKAIGCEIVWSECLTGLAPFTTIAQALS